MPASKLAMDTSPVQRAKTDKTSDAGPRVRLKTCRDAITHVCASMGLESCASTLRSKVTEMVARAQEANVEAGRRGSVQLGRCWRAQKKEDIPSEPGAITIYVSKGKDQVPVRRTHQACVYAEPQGSVSLQGEGDH